MRVRAKRGVCIGVDKHLEVGEHADLDAATVTFLEGIGAVERVPDPPPPKHVEPEMDPQHARDRASKKEK